MYLYIGNLKSSIFSMGLISRLLRKLIQIDGSTLKFKQRKSLNATASSEWKDIVLASNALIGRITTQGCGILSLLYPHHCILPNSINSWEEISVTLITLIMLHRSFFRCSFPHSLIPLAFSLSNAVSHCFSIVFHYANINRRRIWVSKALYGRTKCGMRNE